MTGPTLEPWDVTLDYDGTLSALAGLLGRRVSVVAADRHGKPIIVTRMEGLLRRAHDMTFIRDRPDAEARFFYVGAYPDDERPTGFMLHAGCFDGGDQPSDTEVRFLQGGVLVDVRVDEEREADRPAP